MPKKDAFQASEYRIEAIPEGFPPIVYIVWHDAHYSPEETPLHYVDGLVELHEVGWLLSQTDESVSIAMEYEPGMESTRLYLTIPKVNIKSIVFLSGPDKNRKTGRMRARAKV